MEKNILNMKILLLLIFIFKKKLKSNQNLKDSLAIVKNNDHFPYHEYDAIN